MNRIVYGNEITIVIKDIDEQEFIIEQLERQYPSQMYVLIIG